MNVKDITGQRFGRLTAIKKTNTRMNGSVVWECQCDCGNIALIPSGRLVNGRTQSCGCFRTESASAIAKTGNNRRTHGMKRTKIYYIWCAMKERCSSPKNQGFKNYGARCITVCQEWQDSFEAFYDHVSQLPHFGEPGYSLDRINNDGNYEPGNVKWSTRTEQNQNRRKGKRYGIKG